MTMSTDLAQALTPSANWALAVLIALLIDRVWGEPPVRWHPVVGMGAFLGWAGRWAAPQGGQHDTRHGVAFAKGALAWCCGALVTGGLSVALAWAVCLLPGWGQALVLGCLLKPMLAWRMLHDEVSEVESALGRSLPAGRLRLARLVSRDVAALDAGQVRESAIETLAENLNDSVVAPLFWFAVAGLPGAALYRFANTADAMWGYRGDRQGRDWTWAGKWAARADDVLSWVPARITAVLLALQGGADAWKLLPEQARQTPSPNSGWPMAAMALVLGVRLGKPGVYVLNPAGRLATSAHLGQALQLASRAVLAVAAIAILCLLPGLGRAFE
ncbi:cobalamin biosynthesis protein CobD [Hydrogenophaga crassostreae]|uniref:Cobalamin biosynthesis protein CobD n=1 Tax=Hydrogenophaga crassostreae TaxID=1763535 RepID=A0A162VT55_9BURK|nr:adenosylcobinamide-phosphate synthase CbiB [Hydrogenophaga crassostreae]AOW13062.1 cobalamin biosynthesis protein CobD [Hydrogenophaga crassostreae]OAD40246.1 cobalamin biosynthesis protein CobD [Hydrogenophaga crassostreae]